MNPLIANTFHVGSEVVSLTGSLGQLKNQAIAVAFTAAYSSAATFVILKLVAFCTAGLRADEEDEEQH